MPTMASSFVEYTGSNFNEVKEFVHPKKVITDPQWDINLILDNKQEVFIGDIIVKQSTFNRYNNDFDYILSVIPKDKFQDLYEVI